MGSGWGVVPLRAVVGVVFVVHGTQKLFGFGLAGTAGFLGSLGIPLPTVAAAVVIAVELLGGLALLLGAGTRIDRKSTRLNSSHIQKSRMPSSA